MGFSGYLIGQDDFKVIFLIQALLIQLQGHALACGTSLLLAGAMGPRAIKSGKFMPAGAAASIGMVSAAYQGKKAWEWR